MKNKETITMADGSKYNERELSQLIRRRMMARVYSSPKDYKRHPKHKGANQFVEH